MFSPPYGLAVAYSLGCLYRNTSQQELNLLQFSFSVTEFRAGPAKIMRRELGDPDLVGIIPDHLLNGNCSSRPGDPSANQLK